jgi:hypothetical protein
MKHTLPRITIRMGASTNEAEVDGTTIDLSSLTSGQRKMVRGVVVGALTSRGYFKHD